MALTRIQIRAVFAGGNGLTSMHLFSQAWLLDDKLPRVFCSTVGGNNIASEKLRAPATCYRGMITVR